MSFQFSGELCWPTSIIKSFIVVKLDSLFQQSIRQISKIFAHEFAERHRRADECFEWREDVQSILYNFVMWLNWYQKLAIRLPVHIIYQDKWFYPIDRM